MNSIGEWSYELAFQRNLGLINPDEQQKLKNSRVAIAGMGGVGGVHLITLARLGIGKFTIADPDIFEIANFNRQYGALVSTLNQPKVSVMADMIRDINPSAEIQIFREPLGNENAKEFLAGADLFVDGIDAFEIDARRLLFREAARAKIYTLVAGPIGFSTAWLIFDPNGMSSESYFDFKDQMDQRQKFVAFIVGLTPASTHRAYLDMSKVDVKSHTGPSAGLACQLAAGVVGAEAVKILLGRGLVRPAPYYHQFDPYLGCYRLGRLRGGNRHPFQRFKRWMLEKYLSNLSSSIPGGNV